MHLVTLRRVLGRKCDDRSNPLPVSIGLDQMLESLGHLSQLECSVVVCVKVPEEDLTVESREVFCPVQEWVGGRSPSEEAARAVLRWRSRTRAFQAVPTARTANKRT